MRQGSAGSAPHWSRLRPVGLPQGPHFCPPAPISDCACSHQLAGGRAPRTRGPPLIQALQIPRNVKLRGRGSRREGRSWEPLVLLEIQAPQSSEALLVPRPPSPEGTSCSMYVLHLDLYLCPARSPTSPGLQKPGCLCPGHPLSVSLPFLVPSCVSQPPLPSVLFCMALQLWRKWNPGSP